MDWYEVKFWVEHASGVSMDALHILVGFTLFLLSARLLRRTVSSPLPWFAVLTLELVNEAYDLRVEQWPSIGSQLGEGFKDIILTLALPTLMAAVARWRPGLLVAASTDGDMAGRT